MTLYSTLFSCRTIEVRMRINPRTPKKFNPQSQSWIQDLDNGPTDMVTRYTSKKGKSSLIYNPVIYMSLDVKGGTINDSISVPLGTVYTFNRTLNAVYKRLSTKGLYTRNEGVVMDKALASKLALKFGIYKDQVIIAPAISNTSYDGIQREGVSISTQTGSTMVITHADALALCEVLQNIDISTYTMLAVSLAKNVDIEDKLATMDEKLDRILSMLSTTNAVSKAKEDDGLPPWADV